MKSPGGKRGPRQPELGISPADVWVSLGEMFDCLELKARIDNHSSVTQRPRDSGYTHKHSAQIKARHSAVSVSLRRLLVSSSGLRLNTEAAVKGLVEVFRGKTRFSRAKLFRGNASAAQTGDDLSGSLRAASQQRSVVAAAPGRVSPFDLSAASLTDDTHAYLF